MLNLILTFDYEIFFGKNYSSFEDILFHPTEQLENMLSKKNIKATFFIDICSVIQAKKYNQHQYIDDFINQVMWLDANNQDIQLHIHPHWLKSEFINNEWIFNSNYYRIHSFGLDENGKDTIRRIVDDSIAEIYGILETNGSYKCRAYRAGGFCLQPHEELIKVLYDAGIRIDSSVVLNLMNHSKAHFYDYRHSNKKYNWWISSEKQWNIDDSYAERKLFEIPIGSSKKNPLLFLYNRIINTDSIKLDLVEKRGSFIDSDVDRNSSIIDIMKYVFGNNFFSLDSFRAEFLFDLVLNLYHRLHNDLDYYIALIGHPKMISKEYLDNLECFIDIVNSHNNIRIIPIIDAYKMIYGDI